MGNDLHKKDENAEFLRAVRKMNKEINKQSPTRVSTHIDQKYRNHLLEELHKVQLSKPTKRYLAQTIEDRVTKEDLTACISVLTSLKANKMSSSILKSNVKEEEEAENTDNVVVKIDEKILRRRGKNKMPMSHLSSGHFEETELGRIKFTAAMVCREINKPYHPFRLMCRKYGEHLREDQAYRVNCETEQEYEEVEKKLRANVIEFCKFLIHGTIGLYRKWILEYTGMDERKYEKWLMSIVINQVWAVSDNAFGQCMISVIKRIQVPLKIDFEQLRNMTTYLSPRDFGIDEQLQIEGHYFRAIYELSELPNLWKPADMVKQLEKVQKSICLDVDSYHKLAEKGEVFQINGDNIMGIVAYLLSKVAVKVEEIYTVLMFLKLVYGEIIFYGMDVGSYMYSTITGAIQYLESKNFEGLSKDCLKDTGCSSVVLNKDSQY